MRMKKIFARILVLAILQIGICAGAPMTPEEIEKLMNEMHRARVEYVVKRDDPPL